MADEIILTDSLLLPVDKNKYAEKQLEQAVIDNIHDISIQCNWPEVSKADRQYWIAGWKKRIRADIMVWHRDGTGTLIEVKTNTHNRNMDLMAIGQLLFYGSMIEKRFGFMPRLVIASNEVDKELFHAIKRFNLPICFLMIDGERCIYINQNTSGNGSSDRK